MDNSRQGETTIALNPLFMRHTGVVARQRSLFRSEYPEPAVVTIRSNFAKANLRGANE